MLRFHAMGKKPVRQRGYHELAWTRIQRLVLPAASALLTEGITPTEQDLRMETISITPKQFGLFVIVSDILIDTSAIKLIADAAVEVGNNLARIVDEDIQSNLELN